MANSDDLRFQNSEPRIHSTAQLKSSKLGRYADIGERVILRDVMVGDFTYFERNGEGIYAEIGKFCSIAANVRINALEHPMERLTTHKLSYRPNEYFRYLGVDGEFRARRQAKRVVIGNDVWIGHGAVITPGVTVGHGAVIGANAVVTRDVAPYTVVGGVPAKLIRKRFDDAIIERLLKLNWWDWPVEKLFEAVPDIQTMAIGDFLDKWE
ncbi:antibiotic acetyltransferase [Ochrobactrum sp. P6BS-III]|uniref:DapH/DapD/GlmU-related protein n=1 Tax=unclassified Ochrobactrum TaxID=239106 RepID=UPI00099430E4|nr:phosphonate metabolism protein (transferase hexapeptide repeat family) [Ochrobactrum sp. P6BSIII]OOL16542.1 antibiotic acetyltransferase [Ochrobactrum sp. P6BS-III]